MLKYFEKLGRLSSGEWRIALEAFDLLGKGVVTIGQRQMSFQQIYEYYIDRQYADEFIVQLVSLENLESDAETLQQEVAFDILLTLEKEGLYSEIVNNSEYLAAYCLYWWSAFVKGYRFELTIFRDLHAPI